MQGHTLSVGKAAEGPTGQAALQPQEDNGYEPELEPDESTELPGAELAEVRGSTLRLRMRSTEGQASGWLTLTVARRLGLAWQLA